MCKFSAYVAFITKRQTDIKQCAHFWHTLPLTRNLSHKWTSRSKTRNGEKNFTECHWISGFISVCPFVALLKVKGNIPRMPKICTLFCLVDIKKRSFLTSCVFWFIQCDLKFKKDTLNLKTLTLRAEPWNKLREEQMFRWLTLTLQLQLQLQSQKNSHSKQENSYK